jgi:sugar lactone lactonase YvrE
MQAEQITDSITYHAEGPIWLDRLRFVDMFAGDVLTLEKNGSISRQHVSSMLAALRPRAAGGFVYAIERGFAIDSGIGTTVEPASEPLWETSGIRMNEGSCAPDGAFFAGSMAKDKASPIAALYRFEGSTVTTVLTGITISNGIGWSPSGELAYYVDTPTCRVDMFDAMPSAPWLAERRPFAAPAKNGPGKPDGLTVDSEGGVWVALYGGSAVHRYDSSGALSEVIEIPVRLVTSCCFGGEDLSDLYITTSRENLSPDEEPNAGSIFRVRTGTRGLPVQHFTG